VPPSNLFFTGKFCPLSQRQKEAVDGIGANSNLIDKSCTRESINTCGKSVDEILAEYPIYSPQAEVSTTWGDVYAHWEVLETAQNINFDQTLQTWSEASFKKLVSYYKDSIVVVVEDDGYTISLYKANQDIYAVNSRFDYSKWDIVCSVETSTPTAVPTIAELLSKYEYFNLQPLLSTWGEYLETWSKSLLCDPTETNIPFYNEPYSGQVFTVQVTKNSLPVRGYLYVPNTPVSQLDLVVLYHGTINTPGVTPLNAAQTFLNIARDPNKLNLGNKLIFSVAYPQDAIPGWTQSQANSLFPGLVLSEFTFGENLPYAEAALVWAKTSLSRFLLRLGIEKQAKTVFTFGHSQGGWMTHRLNHLQEVTGVICNAPGPIDLLNRCIVSNQNNDGNVTCAKMEANYGSVYSNPQAYIDESLYNYLEGTLSPTLYTQALDDDTGGTSGFSQVVAMQNTIQPGMESCTNCSRSGFKYYDEGGHDAFVRNKSLQADIRLFIESGADLDATPPQSEQCNNVLDTDIWSEAQTFKKYLYKSGDIVLSSGACGDVVCVWVSTQNLPNTPYLLSKFEKFTPEVVYSGTVSISNGEMVGKGTLFTEQLVIGSVVTVTDQLQNQHEFVVMEFDSTTPDSKVVVVPSTISVESGAKFSGVFWQKIYCVETGFNECLNPSVSSKNNSIPFTAYERVEIGSMGHYVDVPVKYPRLEKALLNELAEVTQNPKTLSEQEVSELKQPGA
jgi:hypothetical protein